MIDRAVQQNEVIGKIAVTDEERGVLRRAHQRVHDAADDHAARNLRERAGRRRSVNVGADDDAKAKAEDVRRRALAGETFAKLAADSRTRRRRPTAA